MFDEIEPACEVEAVNALPHGFLQLQAKTGCPASLSRVYNNCAEYFRPVAGLYFSLNDLATGNSAIYVPIAPLYPFGLKHV